MGNDNKRLHEWLNIHWHDWDGVICPECGAVKADRHTADNTDFSTESGFFALLSGLRAKGFSIVLQFSQGIGRWEACVIIDGRRVFGHHHDTPELALFQAAIKAMTSEEKAD